MSTRTGAGVILLFVVLASLPLTEVSGYTFWKLANGRADLLDRYDYHTDSRMWPGQYVSGNPKKVYDFGDLFDGFTYSGPGSKNQIGLTKEQVEAGLQWAVGAGNDGWEKWANVNFGNTEGATGSMVRIAYDNNQASASTLTYDAGGDNRIDYATITFGRIRGYDHGAEIPWDAEHFRLVMQHELGHVLGLDDLYDSSAPYNEEFVDHAVGETVNPNRSVESRRDNLMNGPWQDRANTIDNDEIAGVSWLWGAPHNQIVTGDLAWSWNAGNGRDVRHHHGTQIDNTLSWWDYRISLAETLADTKPLVDIKFPGYERFVVEAYPAVDVLHTVLPGDIHRFTVDQNGWVGNLTLMLKSKFSVEQRVWSSIVTGGVSDTYELDRKLDGRAYQDGSKWAMPFGPLPEPASAAITALAMLLVSRRRRAP